MAAPIAAKPEPIAPKPAVSAAPAWVPLPRTTAFPAKKKPALTPKEALKQKVRERSAKAPPKVAKADKAARAARAREDAEAIADEGTNIEAESVETESKASTHAGPSARAKAAAAMRPRPGQRAAQLPKTREAEEEEAPAPKPGLWQRLLRAFGKKTKSPPEE